MNSDQAEAILKTVTGLSASHPERLEIATEIADALREAVSTFNCPDGNSCRNQDHWELRA